MGEPRVGKSGAVAGTALKPLAERLPIEITPEMIEHMRKQLNAAGFAPRPQGEVLNLKEQLELSGDLRERAQQAQQRANQTGRPTRDGISLFMPQTPHEAARQGELDAARREAQRQANATGRSVRIQVPGSMPEVVPPEIDKGIYRSWPSIEKSIWSDMK